ncbi:MAG: LysM peptidoglycan-binding domain-containing protein [Verrucomicrobiota bacterium]|nr:LysM peptidoglycan-binding domain-containing protein [Verrucomicrobiota bacterium]
MNTPNPLRPQSSLLEQKAKSKSTLPITVFVLITIHVVLFAGLLIVGCKKKPTPTPSAEQTNATDVTSFPPMETNRSAVTPPVVETNISPVPPPVPPVEHPIPTEPALSPSKEYSVVRNDTLGKIAQKNGVTLKALQDANPDVVPTKLKVGQKLQIPGGATSRSHDSSPATTVAANGDGTSYTVQSGDSLSKIASKHGTTIKEIKSFNQLKTDQIRVGQKLKLPGKTASTENATPLRSSAATDK